MRGNEWKSVSVGCWLVSRWRSKTRRLHYHASLDMFDSIEEEHLKSTWQGSRTLQQCGAQHLQVMWCCMIVYAIEAESDLYLRCTRVAVRRQTASATLAWHHYLQRTSTSNEKWFHSSRLETRTKEPSIPESILVMKTSVVMRNESDDEKRTWARRSARAPHFLPILKESVARVRLTAPRLAILIDLSRIWNTGTRKRMNYSCAG